ncbi:MAG: hypothetical protein KDD25_00710, partial [Bdellovibrionales bacterium]|nr:hypothetical protein [Bdellovibrionales bacterium]
EIKKNDQDSVVNSPSQLKDQLSNQRSQKNDSNSTQSGEQESRQSNVTELETDQETGSSSSEASESDVAAKKTLTRKEIQTRIDTLNYFLYLKNGVEPSEDPQEVRVALDQFNSLSDDYVSLNQSVISKWNEIKEEPQKNQAQNCVRYHIAIKDAVEDFRTYDGKSWKKLSEEDKVFARVRQEISRAFLSNFIEGVKNEYDGGFLGEFMNSPCLFEGRDSYILTLNAMMSALDQYWTLRYGVEPALGKELLSDLTVAGKSYEKSQRLKKGLYYAGVTIVTIAFWELAIVRGVALVGEAASWGSATVMGVRALIGAGMGTGLYFLDRSFQPEEYRLPMITTMSQWNNLLSEWEAFHDLSLRSPKEYAPYIIETDKSRLEWLQDFLEKRGDHLVNVQNHWGSIEAALEYHLQLLSQQE